MGTCAGALGVLYHHCTICWSERGSHLSSFLFTIYSSLSTKSSPSYSPQGCCCVCTHGNMRWSLGSTLPPPYHQLKWKGIKFIILSIHHIQFIIYKVFPFLFTTCSSLSTKSSFLPCILRENIVFNSVEWYFNNHTRDIPERIQFLPCIIRKNIVFNSVEWYFNNRMRDIPELIWFWAVPHLAKVTI